MTVPGTMAALLADLDAIRSAIVGALAREPLAPGRPLSAIVVLPPVTRPGKIVAVGRNDHEHAAEEGTTARPDPVVFTKFSSAVVGDGAEIVWRASDTQQVDDEAELAVVIGRTARDVPAERAMEHVLGYSCLNDVSARDLQAHDGEWVRAKCLDTFCPIGPWITTVDELPDPVDLRIRCLVNGEALQDARTSTMVHDVPSLIAFCSRFMTLEPGDVIATGTPGGVGASRQPPRFLADGDLVEIDIEGVGRLSESLSRQRGLTLVSGGGASVEVALAYGDGRLTVRLPAAATTVITPRPRPAAPDPLATLREAIERPVAGPPLRELARPGQRVAISVCDVTRPQPRPIMLQAIMEVLDGIIRPDDVVVLIATGTHRPSTTDERQAMLGDGVLDTWRVMDHDARDRSGLVDLGMVGDVPVWLAREWVDADLRITTGFVEPHFFAGFSGGPKMVAPGLAGIDTTLALHDARRIGDPRATWGVIEGNPVHDAVRAITRATRVDFSIDVLLDDAQRITQAFAGETLAMHAAACAVARREAMRAVDAPFDLVITTNSGYPLDQNLYQAVKGMSAAAEIVRPGGTIICAAECRDGLPDHGAYGRLLREGHSPRDLLERIAASPVTIPDQWQVQIQARVQMKADVLLRCDGLSDAEVRAAHLEPIHDIEEVVERVMHGDPSSRICVLPQGPQTIAYVA